MQITYDLNAQQYKQACIQAFGHMFRGLFHLWLAVLGLAALLLLITQNFAIGLSTSRLVASPLFWVAVAVTLLTFPPVFGRFMYFLSYKEGGVRPKNDHFTVLIDERGIAVYRDGVRAATYSYYALSGVLRTKAFLFAQQKNGFLCSIPLAAFSSEEQAHAAEATMRNGIAYASGGYAPVLELPAADCIWRFCYPFDTYLATEYTKYYMKSNTKKRLRSLLVGLALFLLLGGIIVAGIVSAAVSYASGGAAIAVWAAILAASIIARARQSKTFINSLPAHLMNHTTLEVGAQGLRVYTQHYETLWQWQDVTRAETSPAGTTVLLYKKALITAVPAYVAPPEVLQAVREYVNTQAQGGAQTNR